MFDGNLFSCLCACMLSLTDSQPSGKGVPVFAVFNTLGCEQVNLIKDPFLQCRSGFLCSYKTAMKLRLSHQTEAEDQINCHCCFQLKLLASI